MHYIIAVGQGRWKRHQEEYARSDSCEWFLSDETPEAGKGMLVLCYTETLPNTIITFLHNICNNAYHSEDNYVLVYQFNKTVYLFIFFKEQKDLTLYLIYGFWNAFGQTFSNLVPKQSVGLLYGEQHITIFCQNQICCMIEFLNDLTLWMCF